MELKEDLVNFWRENFGFRERELKAFSEIDRSMFVPGSLKNFAYQDTPLPLMRGKTISQPTTVMIMTYALELNEGEKVFEVGTGSGYQAAIIAKIVGENGKVITTEVIPELVDIARANLKNAGLKNVEVYEEDGSKGFPKEAPFDRIIITAACSDFPESLIKQLKDGGIIIAPIGNREEQQMVKGVKNNEKMDLEFLGPFLFTPMYGKYGFEV